MRLGLAVTCMCWPPRSCNLSQAFSCHVLSGHLCSPPWFFHRAREGQLAEVGPSAEKRKLGLGVMRVHRVGEAEGCDQSERKSAPDTLSASRPGTGALT